MSKNHLSSRGISRRTFLASMALLAVSTRIKAKFHDPALFAQQNQTDEFAFVELPGLGPEMETPIVEKLFVPLHPAKKLSSLPNMEQELKYIESLLKNMLLKQGMRWHDSYGVDIQYQHFGIAHPFQHSAQLLKHCRNAHDYLYQHLKGLRPLQLHWSMLQPNSKAQVRQENGLAQQATDAASREPVINPPLPPQEGISAVIGRYNYHLLRARVRGIEHDDAPSLASAAPVNRAIHYIECNKTFDPLRGVIYVVPGATSLLSPFSEVLHFSLHAPSRLYEQNLRKRMTPDLARHNAINAGETINEAASILMALEYINKYGHPDRANSLKALSTYLSHHFLLLPNTLSYMQQKGVQYCIDLFADNPSRLMMQVAES